MRTRRRFILDIEGNQNLETKYAEAMEAGLYQELVICLAKTVVLALRLNAADEIAIAGFGSDIIEIPPELPKEDPKKDIEDAVVEKIEA